MVDAKLVQDWAYDGLFLSKLRLESLNPGKALSRIALNSAARLSHLYQAFNSPFVIHVGSLGDRQVVPRPGAVPVSSPTFTKTRTAPTEIARPGAPQHRTVAPPVAVVHRRPLEAW